MIVSACKCCIVKLDVHCGCCGCNNTAVFLTIVDHNSLYIIMVATNVLRESVHNTVLILSTFVSQIVSVSLMLRHQVLNETQRE